MTVVPPLSDIEKPPWRPLISQAPFEGIAAVAIRLRAYSFGGRPVARPGRD